MGHIPLKDRFVFTPLSEELLHPLNSFEEYVIKEGGTERPFSGIYNDTTEEGTYYCRQCNSPLYYSTSKFSSDCGWPSFDDELPHAVTKQVDSDGLRTEIICSTCQGHLGHLFFNEGYTVKNRRHCVNSVSLLFKRGEPVATALFAGGCFWGVEHLMGSLKGVYEVISGYCGGKEERPTYQQVLNHQTHHVESVQVLYNPLIISYQELAKYFFEIHDPYQSDGQGPDIGPQYLSTIFYRSRFEFETLLALIEILESDGKEVATTLQPASRFWPAEEYHQNYYTKTGKQPYCHNWQKRF